MINSHYMFDALQSSTLALLAEDLPTTTSDVKASLRASMKLTGPILAARVEAQHTLAIKREQHRHPAPEKGEPRLTDFDRTTMLEAAVSEYTATYELLRGLETLLGERIQVLRTLL